MAETVERPDLAAVKEYLGPLAANQSDTAVGGALAAETAAQASACRVVPYAPPLAEALLRRVSRNLAMRGLPLGVMSDEMGSTRVGGNDPEVRRLEGPYRKRVCG
ncbi:MAG: hypothetical protein QM621_14880 [Aeromicrobium sp.]|uniref:hypothetical protein n=1 Tax=Aeromicrobium sp. TaxID=1871063 RepID=UPI0039E3268C